MHAVVVRVKIGDVSKAREGLRSRVLPAVTQSPGFRRGVWLAPADGASSGDGLSVVTFESEQHARDMLDRVKAMQFPDTVELVDVEVREVNAEA